MLTKGAAFIRLKNGRLLQATLRDTDFTFAPGGLDAYTGGMPCGCYHPETGKEYPPVQYEAKYWKGHPMEGQPILDEKGQPELWPKLDLYYHGNVVECVMATPEVKVEYEAQLKTDKQRLEIIARMERADAAQLAAILKILN